jgi:FkbM family methyltransferase
MDIGNLYERARAAVDAQCHLGKSGLQIPIWAGRKIVIYGAGGFGRDIATILLERGAALLGFLDRKGTGQIVRGDLRAYSLGSDEARKWLGEKPVVIIGAFNYAVSIRALADALREHGFSNVLTPMECYPHLAGALGWRYWLGTSQDYTGTMPLIEKTYSLWADDESRRLFLETLLFRLESNLAALTTISGEDCQYADPTVPRFDEPLRMVDGGAYLGDAGRCLIRHHYRIECLYAFEPDLANFKQLRAAAPAISTNAHISLWPCGVWSSTCHLKFSDGENGASRLSETGASTVPVVALDDVLIHQPINLIKLDVEGAEPDALQGARHLIEKFRPNLAICLYHYPHHLWSIPLWVHDLDLGYRLYYRAHQQNSFDTVLYAISE